MRGVHRAAALTGVVLVLGVTSGADPAAAVTGEEVIERVRQELEKSRTLSARFERQFFWSALAKRSNREGRIYLERPNRFRLQMDGGDLVVADGSAIWAYSSDNQQVVVSSYQGEVRTPWEVLTNYADTYAPTAVEEVELHGQGCYLLVLRPQAADALVTQITVWVERQHWLVLKVEQLEANDNVITYQLTDHQTNTRLKDELFRYTPPVGVEVVDRREPAPGNG